MRTLALLFALSSPALAADAGSEFAYFIGTWHCQEKWSKTDFSPAYESTSTLEAIDKTDGKWIVWSYVQDASPKNPHPAKGADLWGYDPAHKQFVREKADTYAPGVITHLTSKGFVGDTVSWEGQAATPKGPAAFRHTFKKLSDRSIEGRLYMGGQPFYQGTCEKSDNARLVRDFVETVKNQRKLDRLGDFFHADYVEHNSTVASFGKGVDGYKAFLGHLFSAYPDDVLKIEELVSDGDRVAYRATESGTNKGKFLNVPATQKRATWTEIQFFRIKDGKIAEHWVDVDLFSWFTQLGIIPPMGK